MCVHDRHCTYFAWILTACVSSNPLRGNLTVGQSCDGMSHRFIYFYINLHSKIYFIE